MTSGGGGGGGGGGVILQLTVSQSWLRAPSGTHDQMLPFKIFVCFLVLGCHRWRDDGSVL